MPNLDITPDPGFFAVLPHVSYKAWYALAEFVDNSIQSYVNNDLALKANQLDYQLLIEIDIDNAGDEILIRDNAAGICIADFPRAFRVASPPPDKTGLSQFGMGLKTAACWFGRRWSVKTSALGESVERTIEFDVPKIIQTGSYSLGYEERPVPSTRSYTEVRIWNLNRSITGATAKKIATHLASIHRKFLNAGEAVIEFKGEPLHYNYPAILTAPYFRTPEEPPKVWREEVDLKTQDGITIQGFLAIAEKISKDNPGLALFQRNRLIVGEDGSYIPEDLFGASNDYVARKVFGDLEISNLQLSHTKSSFQNWEAAEESIIKLLGDHLKAQPESLLQQARHYRPEPKHTFEDFKSSESQRMQEAALGSAAQALNEDVNAAAAIEEIGGGTALGPTIPQVPESQPSRQVTSTQNEFRIRFREIDWDVTAKTVAGDDTRPWVKVIDVQRFSTRRIMKIEFSLDHPYNARFLGAFHENLHVLLRIAIGLCLAEVAASDGGTKNAFNVRSCLNDLLTNVLSRPTV